MKTKIGLSTLILALLILVVVMYFKVNSLERERTLQAVKLSTLQDSVDSYVNKNGELIAKINSVEVEKGDLKKSLEVAGFEIKDLKADNIKWRKLTNVLQLQLQAVGEGQSTVHDTFYVSVPPNDSIPPDTIPILKIDDWTNNHLTLFDQRIENYKHFFNYRYDIDAKLFIEGTRKEPIVTVKLDDKFASITRGNSITVPYKTKWYEKPWVWGLAGLTTGYFISK